MTQAELETFTAALEDVQREENFGYAFFFVGDDHRLPFVTFANSDNEYDKVSNLDREGVFRVNIGVSKQTFDDLVGGVDPASADYTALNTLDRAVVVKGVMSVLEDEDFFGTEFVGDPFSDPDDIE